MSERRFTRSLTGRLLLIFLGMGVLFVVLVGATMGRAFKDHFELRVRPHLRQYLDYIQADIGTPPDYGRAAELARSLGVTIQIDGPGGRWASDGAPIDLSSWQPAHRLGRGAKRYAWGDLRGRQYLEIDSGGYRYAYSIPREHSVWHLAWPLLVLLLVLTLLYFATRRLFAPIATLKAGVERIGRGEFEHRIEVKRRDELGELAGSINAMADDVQQMLDSKRQLLLAISHELRSPLTRAKVATSLVEEEQQRIEIERELCELEKLIEELLETERLASRHQTLQKQRIDLSVLLAEAVGNLRDQGAVRLSVPPHPVELELDPVRMRLLVKNLLENALRHTPPEAPAPELAVSLAAEGGATVVEIVVRDHGPGIAAEHLPHVTEPFYRADPARRRETGGYGLGLYLCRRIAEAHGGSLAVTSIVGGGATVRVRIPMEVQSKTH